MKKLLLWIAAFVFGLVLLFGACVAIVNSLVGDHDTLAGGDGVGVVELKGVIVDGQETIRQLRAMKKDEHAKAVVFRVDSPGGVVGPSQEIYAAVKDLAKAKKVVVSMGSVAASGGYYVSAPASLIYANPGTITGSIGVLMKFSNLQGLMDKVGMKAFTIKTGKFKDTGSPARAMTDEEKAMLQGVIDSTHGQFVKAVAQGRRLPEAQVRSIADGRIFSGEQALALKLVDRIGSMQDAIDEAARLGGIEGEPRLIRPAKKRGRALDYLVESAAQRLGVLSDSDSGVSVDYRLGW
ncbi:signal peptide peptidase SppA [Geomonas sp. Red69]|uniref:Signal peptide peptidase SppA n=1 Tax=Geomonas diazotrophica TaxID=2843197 RepID=A0ABX8JME7_9BACT|nr:MULTISPECIES: signal peptide peptidase SppA [Geomonas]MBU5636638.1 signal peptide peptidase SppA [Geomonas diazotrophica]QWV98542.1 signal peptide peptidase SppA [Geomonas nitrogeniifigens]QXE87725.1 signal peptide peptidase SppA [Geomonas nitrogeniifigens]